MCDNNKINCFSKQKIKGKRGSEGVLYPTSWWFSWALADIPLTTKIMAVIVDVDFEKVLEVENVDIEDCASWAK